MLSKIGRFFLVDFFRRDAFVAISTAFLSLPDAHGPRLFVDAMPLLSGCQLRLMTANKTGL
jgi:hypothetical protein